jgi:hypothetical protein
MKWANPVLYILSLNIASWILSLSGAVPSSRLLWLNATDITTTFGLTIFGGVALGGGLAGLLSVFTNKSVYAMGILVIWIIGIMLPIGIWFLNGTSLLITGMIPVEVAASLWYVPVGINALFTFVTFMFFVELASQRNIT